MSKRLRQAQAEKIKLLRGADEGTLPKDICQDSADFSYNVLAELLNDKFMEAARHDRIVNPCFYNVKITSAGRRRLKELERSRIVAFYLQHWPWLWGVAIAIVLGIWKR